MNSQIKTFFEILLVVLILEVVIKPLAKAYNTYERTLSRLRASGETE